MKNFYLVLVIFLLFTGNAFAQKDTATYYLTAGGQVVVNKSECAFFIKISPSDSMVTPKMYKVSGFYKDGKKLLSAYSLNPALPLKLQGDYVTFFLSGKPMSVRSFKNGEPTGTTILYYPNGKFYSKVTRELMLTDSTRSYDECRDSTGKVLTKNGNGDWITFDQNFSFIAARGHVKNYKADSIWTFESLNGKTNKITYKNGIDISSNGSEEKIFSSVEQQPEFPGGPDALRKFLAVHVKYPATALEQNIEGRVLVDFVVEKDGSLSNIRISRGIGGNCEQEAIRVIKLSPRWMPGTIAGRPVRVAFTIPVDFYKNGHVGF